MRHYVRANYTRLSQAEDIWILNEYREEAEEKLRKNGYGQVVFPEKENYTALAPVEYYAGQSVKGSFVAKREAVRAVKFCASCFRRRSDPRLTIHILDLETKEVCGEGKISGSEIADDFYSRCPLQASLTPGKTYEIEIFIERIDGKGDMEFYFRTKDELAFAVEYD